MIKQRKRDGIVWIILFIVIMIASVTVIPNIYSRREAGGGVAPEQMYLTNGILLICVFGIAYGVYRLRKK